MIGPRRVGKTVAMYQTVQELLTQGVDPDRLWWLHMAHPLLINMPLGILVKQLCSKATVIKPTFVFVDELTYADKWDVWFKTLYDENLPIRVVGTSSSTAALREGRIESGIGRWEEQYLSPCLFTEYLHLRDKPVVVDPGSSFASTIEHAISAMRITSEIVEERQRFMLVGGFPELLMDQCAEREHENAPRLENEVYRSQRVLRDDAIQKAIYQDIPQVFGVRSPIALERLLYTLAGQMTGLVSHSTLSVELGISRPAIEDYIRYLERSYLVFQLPNYAPTEEAVQRRGRKIFFVDSAVRNAALQRGTAILRNPSEMGHLIENTVGAHLHALSQQSGVRLYHWRDGKAEVDFVYDDPRHPLALEVASSPNHSPKGLNTFREKYPRFNGGCYLVNSSAISSRATQDSIGRLSVDLLLIAAGAQAQRELRMRLSTEPIVTSSM